MAGHLINYVLVAGFKKMVPIVFTRLMLVAFAGLISVLDLG